jgi:hypothetical protein
MDVKNTEAMIELLKKELGPLAQAIGQGAGKTFEIFVRQAWVNAIQGLLFIPVGVIVFILGIIMYKKGSEKDEYGDTKWCGFEWIILLMFVGISLIMTLAPISDLIQVKINPEYAALNLMISTFKNER